MPFTFPVEAGHILMFARAIGDPNPVYADAERAAESEVGGIVAPPTFARACAQFDPDWPLRPRVGEAWVGSGREPTGLPPAQTGEGTSLHAEQHFEYHRPLRPGDLLTCTSHPGRTWEKKGRRGGLLRFGETVTEFRDASGELTVTMRTVSVHTERVVTGEQG